MGGTSPIAAAHNQHYVEVWHVSASLTILLTIAVVVAANLLALHYIDRRPR